MDGHRRHADGAARLPPIGRCGALPSSFDVEGVASGAFAVLGLAAALWRGSGGAIAVDPVAACTAVRSEQALRIDGAAPGPVWDPLSRTFAARDGWVRLHGNYRQHRMAIERALGSVEPEAVAARIAAEEADAIEAAV
ncbi:MAG: hypothetical protein QM679_06250, partial [Patulibacter sp.]